jgi:hypothetical protein
MCDSRLELIFEQANVDCFDDDYRQLVKNAISDLYSINPGFLKSISIYHLDRAIFKYKESSEKRIIYNTRSYFMACLKSALVELEIDQTAFKD